MNRLDPGLFVEKLSIRTRALSLCDSLDPRMGEDKGFDSIEVRPEKPDGRLLPSLRAKRRDSPQPGLRHLREDGRGVQSIKDKQRNQE